MTIVEKIEKLKNKLSTVRSNSEYNKVEKQILKLAKQFNNQNHEERFFIYENTVYGLQKNPNHFNDAYYGTNTNNWDSKL